MLFPKGEVRYKNLSTVYTDIPALLKTMKSEGFSGTIELEFPGNQGTIFISSGEIINAEVRNGVDSNRMIRQEALQVILSLSNQKDGTLNVHRMPSDRVVFVASTLQSEILFKDLLSDFIRLDRLILKLREDKHNGFIEILTKEHKGMGILFFQDGDVADLFATSESGPSLVEKKTIPLFLEYVVKQGAVFNLHQTQGKTPVKESPIKESPVKESPVKESPVREMPEKELRFRETPEKEPRLRETPEKELRFREAPAKEPIVKEPAVREHAVKEPSVKKMSLEETPGAGEKGGLKEVIPILQDILSRVENVADTIFPKGAFLKEFKMSLIEKSVEYPFLDPFAGEFEYTEGMIGFKGDAGTKEFAKGIGECLRVTLSHLEEEFPKSKILPEKLILEVEFLLEHYREGMRRLGIDNILHSIFK